MRLRPGVVGAATVSDCGQYRYDLTRMWDPGQGHLPGIGTRGPAGPVQAPDALCLWIMLNPSTAHGEDDDPTARKIQGFSALWGFCGLAVVNLFALRADKPLPLYRHADPVGPLNNEWIRYWLDHPDVTRVVEAWGVHGEHRRRGDRVHQMVVESRHREVTRMLTTAGGEPGHPLYLPWDCQTIEVRPL